MKTKLIKKTENYQPIRLNQKQLLSVFLVFILVFNFCPIISSSQTIEELLEAVDKCDLKQVTELVNKGASTSATDSFGKTALFHAVMDAPTINASINIGANNTIESGNFVYTTQERIKIVEYLIQNNANVNAKDLKGNTPLFDAYTSEMVKFLVSKGSDVNARNNEGLTPLHDAMSMLFIETASADVHGDHNLYLNRIKALIEAGADINIKSNVGKTPLDYGIRGFSLIPPVGGIENDPVIRFMRSKGAKTSQ